MATYIYINVYIINLLIHIAVVVATSDIGDYVDCVVGRHRRSSLYTDNYNDVVVIIHAGLVPKSFLFGIGLDTITAISKQSKRLDKTYSTFQNNNRFHYRHCDHCGDHIRDSSTSTNHDIIHGRPNVQKYRRGHHGYDCGYPTTHVP